MKLKHCTNDFLENKTLHKEPDGNVTPTLLTLRFSSLLAGQSFGARLTEALAHVAVHENHAIVSAGPAVAGVTLAYVLLDGPAEVELFHPGTRNLLHQLGDRPQLPKTTVVVRQSKGGEMSGFII